MTRRLAAIMIADVVGFSALMASDEAGTLAALKQHHADHFDPHITRRNGRIVKLVGDGFLAEFTSVVDAVECALAIQQTLSLIDDAFALRIGINLGDVIVDGDDIYGDGVNVAARLESLSEPGSICLSGPAHDMVVGKVDCAFRDLGLKQLKNIAKPVHVFQIASGSPAPHSSAPATPERYSIAVLPFSNMSGDTEQEYFSDGIAEDIITDLSRISRLFVVARNSTFAYKGQSVNVRQISTDLDAMFILEGSVRKSGNRVRVTAQLIDGQTGGHLWAERYDRDLTDVFEVQDEITRNIVDALKIVIAPKEKKAIERVPTRNLQAYDCYLQGRQLMHSMSRDNLENARKLFLRAVELDPGYAIALTGLSDCDATYYHFYSSEPEMLDTAEANSRRALEVAPGMAEAHASLAFVLMLKDDTAGAIREFNTALEIDPMLYEAFWNFGMFHVVHNDFETAADLFHKAARVRGDDLQSKMMLMTLWKELGHRDRMLTLAHETFSIASRLFEYDDRNVHAAYIGAFALIHLGDRDRALDWLQKAVDVAPADPRSTYNIACAYSMLGDRDNALAYLRKSIMEGRPIRMMKWATEDPDLAPLRQDPRFDDLMKIWRARMSRPPAQT